MIVGALRLPVVISGMIDASTTRRPCMPCTRPSPSTTAMSSVPIARARRVEGGFGVFAYELVQLLVSLHVDARADFTTAVRIQSGLLHDLPGQADAVTELLPVLLGGHVVEQDAWAFTRVLGLELHAATAWRTHGAHVRLEAVFFHAIAAVVVNRYRQEVVLNVRPVELFTGANETARDR